MQIIKSYAPKVGAIFYVLWGLLHIAGGAALLQQLSAEGASGALAALGSAVPTAELPSISGGVVAAVLTFFAWNWLWIGLLVLVIGATLNWKNSRWGYWLNLAVVSAADLGLIATLLIPGYMALADGMPGIVLWLPAAVFSTIGLVSNRTQQSGEIALT